MIDEINHFLLANQESTVSQDLPVSISYNIQLNYNMQFITK